MTERKVTVYSTPTCHWCRVVKEFLSQKGVGYTEKDVAADAMARDEMLRLTGRMAVPAITIGNEVVLGFDKQRLEQLLA